MIFIDAYVAASHFDYYILRLSFDGQFHIVQLEQETILSITLAGSS